MQRRFDLNKKLWADNAISEFELKSAEKEKVSAESTLDLAVAKYEHEAIEITSQLNDLYVKRALVRQKIDESRLEIMKREAFLKEQHTLANEKVRLNFGESEITGQSLLLKSSVNGTISFLFEGEKELLPGTILLKIIGTRHQLYAISSVSPQRVGYLREEQNAILKVNTFPHYEWGTLSGKVKNLSLTSDEHGQYLFEIDITDYGKMNDLLQIGMTGKVSIITEQKTFANLLFEKYNTAVDKYLDRIE